LPMAAHELDRHRAMTTKLNRDAHQIRALN
jgi:hypothetical protein